VAVPTSSLVIATTRSGSNPYFLWSSLSGAEGGTRLVFVRRPGPAIHHFAYIVSGIHDIIRACDVAGSLGLGDCVEYGPGRHSLGHSIMSICLILMGTASNCWDGAPSK
jgi:hypothetical protein